MEYIKNEIEDDERTRIRIRKSIFLILEMESGLDNESTIYKDLEFQRKELYRKLLSLIS